RAERVTRYELAVDQELGAFSVEARTFQEGVRDRLVNQFEDSRAPHALRVSNGGALAARGMGLRVSRRFGDAIQGTMTYTYGRSWRRDPAAVAATLAAGRPADFHDLAARVETVIEGTDT